MEKLLDKHIKEAHIKWASEYLESTFIGSNTPETEKEHLRKQIPNLGRVPYYAAFERGYDLAMKTKKDLIK